MSPSSEIPTELQKAGARYRSEDIPDKVGLEWFTERCEQYERILRKQYEDGELPEHDERELAKPSRQLTNLQGAIRRFCYLKHLYLSRHEDRVRKKEEIGSPAEEDEMRAMVDLLERKPVTVRLTNRTVEVTDRSYAALRRVGAHAKQIQKLDRELSRIDDLQDRLFERLSENGDGSRTQVYRRLHWLNDLADAIREEKQNHRRAICAHLTTESGAPAESIEEAPEWAEEIGPIDELALIVGVRRAMRERIDRLGERPEHPRDSDAEQLEDWGMPGFLIPFRDFDGRTPVDPAAPINQPLAQKLAANRADSPTVLESDLEDEGP